jgi:RsiW-degrading membrane proteinase PrsW (M82 family)
VTVIPVVPGAAPPPPPDSANPQHHAHSGYRTALAIVVGILVMLFIGSIVGTTIKSDVAIINLVGLVVVGFFAGGTYLLVIAFSLKDKAKRHRRVGIASIVLGIALLLWMLVVAALIANLNILGAIISIPTTGFAIWVLRHLNRNQHEPWRLVLAAFGWGGVVAVNIAIVLEGPFDRIFVAGLIPGPGQGLSGAWSAAVFEELPKGLAVVLLYLVMRKSFDDVVDGILYGAMVGLGFNFVEGLGYMAAHGIIGQFYVRQLLGLFTGHTTYTALIGAGLGVARQQNAAWKRLVAILSGFTAAVAAHFLWDAAAMTSFLPHTSNAALEVFVFLPLRVLLIDGPFTAMVLALLILGLRREGRILRTELNNEAGLGLGTVLPEEVEILANPRKRASWRRSEFSHFGWKGYRWLGRLQRAQLALAWERWHRANQDIDEPLEEEERLRQHILAIRAGGR